MAVNNIEAGRRIADYLYGKGYRRIAFLMQDRNPFSNTNWGNRLLGLAGHLALLGCEDSVRQLNFAPEDATSLARLLRGRTPPEALVCGNDESAIALVRTLQTLGKRIPEDIAVIGFDDIPEARDLQPPLTTVSQPVRSLAATAFKTLLARIRYPNNDPREIYLPAPLIIRATT